MPYGAFWVTVTGAPAWPSFDDDVGLADGGPADGELAGAADEAAEPMPAGTDVACMQMVVNIYIYAMMQGA